MSYFDIEQVVYMMRRGGRLIIGESKAWITTGKSNHEFEISLGTAYSAYNIVSI